MNSLVNTNFSRTYNPSGRQNAVSDIKRLLTSRDTEAQKKACGYLIEVINSDSKRSYAGTGPVKYLLDNDITVFLCDATSNLDFTLFRSILSCVRLLWRERCFFTEEHAAIALAAVSRALAHYASTGGTAAVEACLHFLCDLLDGISTNETTPPLSHQSPYTLQLLACFNSLAPRINTNSKTILCGAIVLQSLISYQPDTLTVDSGTATALAEVLNQWFALILGAMNHVCLVGDEEMTSSLLGVLCQLGMNVLRLIKLFHSEQHRADFVQAILTDKHELDTLKQCADEMRSSMLQVISDLVAFTQANQDQISTEEYCEFLKFLLNVLYDNAQSEHLPDLCDVMFAKGYLTMLPQVQISRNDLKVRKVSTLVLGEMLKVLSSKYLNVDSGDEGTCAHDIYMGLKELHYGVDELQSIGEQLEQSQPYSLLIYIYFYCQSSDNPDEATAPLLPHLVSHIIRLPRNFTPPPYIIKALWLVFAMSTISNDTVESLEQRVYLEKATDRLVTMLNPDPSVYYTHHPALLLWAFTSHTTHNHVTLHVLSQWLKTENSLPSELTTEPIVWELLLNILVQSEHDVITSNCMETLQLCLKAGDEDDRQTFACYVWSTLPGVLSKQLIDSDSEIETNMCYLLDIATSLLPTEPDQTVCLKTAVLIATIFSKNKDHSTESAEAKQQFEYLALKLSLYLLGLSSNQSDNRVLLTFINRMGYLPAVLAATYSCDDRVASMALLLLSAVVHYFTKNNYHPKSVLEIQTTQLIKSLRRDSLGERGSSILQLVHMVLSSGRHTPLVLSYDMGTDVSKNQQCNALRALMFGIQITMCRESKEQSLLGWKTLTSIFKHAIVYKNDQTLVATLTSQPWTNALIKFQFTYGLNEEFLTFIFSWLILIKITIKKSQDAERKIQMCKRSLLVKTVSLIKNNLATGDEELKEVREKILVIVREILEMSTARLSLLQIGFANKMKIK